jgi:anti-sigma regulatory factor (Ser/Thr protein kinase)
VIGTDPRVTTSLAKVPGTEWDLRTFLELGALPTAVPCARLHTRQVLWEWHLDALSYTAELVVSELVTNAVQASTGLTGSRRSGRWVPGTPPVRVWLSSDRQRVLIRVWDGSDRHPAPQHPGPDAESGRGLLLVESLSADWGSYPPDKSDGKVVWALIVPG